MEKTPDIPIARASAEDDDDELALSSFSPRHLFVFTTWRHAPPLVLALFSTACVAGIKASLSIVVGKIFEVVAKYGAGILDGEDALSEITPFCLILCGMGGGAWLANSCFLSSWILFGELQGKNARKTVFDSLVRQEMSWFDSQADGVSSLFVRMETQIRELQLANSQILGLILADTMTALASLSIAFYFCWKLTLVLLATVPVTVAVGVLAGSMTAPAVERQKIQLSRASKHAAASILAIDLVKVFNGFDQEVWQYYQNIKRATKYYLVQAHASTLQMTYVAILILVLFIIGFWYGLVLVDDGVSPGSIITAFYSVLAAFQGIETFAPQFLVVAKGISAGLWLKVSVIESGLSSEARDARGKQRPAFCRGEIELHGVTFAYPSKPDEDVVMNAHMSFLAGKTTFLVGGSGSGKSTIGSMLVGFYRPTSGLIVLDHQPLQRFDQQWIRDNITLIQQSSVLFDDTFFANVAMGHRNPESATREEVLAACESALLQTTLSELPQGLDTKIGPTGYSLSGGQKQRLALARARLRDSPVMILDEVTSGLDQVSRTLVMDAIRQWRRGKTTIIITHDVSQIAGDDFVYVMDKGRLVQGGTRKELVTNPSGTFAGLVAASHANQPAAEAEAKSAASSRPPTPSSESTKKSNRMRRLSRLIRDTLQPIPASTDVESKMAKHTSLGAATQVAAMLRTKRTLDRPAGSEMAPLVSTRSSSPLRKEHSTGNPWDRKFSVSALRRSSLFKSPSSMMASQDMRKKSLPENIRRSSVQGARRFSVAPLRRQSSMDLIQAAASRVQNSRGDGNRRRRPSSFAAVRSRRQSTTELNRETSLSGILQTVWPTLTARQKMSFVLAVALCGVVAGSNSAFSWIFAQLLEVMWSTGDRVSSGRKWALTLIGIGSADATATYISHYTLEYIGQSWVDTLRLEAIKRVLQQPHAWFHSDEDRSQAVSRVVDRDAEEARNIVGRFLPIVVIIVIMTTTSVGWAMSISWKLSLVAIAPTPLIYFISRLTGVVCTRCEHACNKAAAETSAILTETCTNIRVVHALSLEARFLKKYDASMASTFGTGLKRAAYSGCIFGLQQSTQFLMAALIFYYSSIMLCRNREISVVEVLEVVNLLLFCFSTVTSMVDVLPQVTASKASAAQVLKITDLPVDCSETKGTIRLDTPLPICMQDLTFAYPGRPTTLVLRGINLKIQGGTCTAIVGSSGCGKSTVMSVLLGLHPPTLLDSGAQPPLTYSGVPYEHIEVQNLRSMMAYVPQTAFLFPDSIKENVLYGLAENSPLRAIKNVEDALEAAGMLEYVSSLPEGIETAVGEGGQTLSGGQAQRINIARALVRKPALLVMDEPTSALDAESAENIRQTVLKLMAMRPKGRKARSRAMAIVIVTHSEELMRVTDRIVLLENGVVAEEGPFATLVDQRGRFAQLIGGGEWVGQSAKPEEEKFSGFRSVDWNTS